MLHVVKMKAPKYFWILISFLFIVLCVSIAKFFYTNYIFEDKHLNRRQSLKDGEEKTVVFDKQLDLFIGGHPISTVVEGESEKFNYSLNEEEKKRIHECQANAAKDYMREMGIFFSNNQICVNHHRYLKAKDSILIEVGGNLGSDASLFTAMYNPRHIIMEPLEYYANLLKEKFKENSRVTVLNLGLGKETGIVLMEVAGEASSINAKTGNTLVDVINPTEFFQNIGVGIYRVDLLTMDCEGCELDVLENLVETGMVKYFTNIQFELHGVTLTSTNYEYLKRYCTLQEYMKRTHRLTFQVKQWWENWRLK